MPESLQALDLTDKEEQEQKRMQKLQKLGLQCVSPGLANEKMDNRMLTTIKLSKDMEREQREVIMRMSENKEQEKPTTPTATSSRGKSLKRSKIPPPLNIPFTNGNKLRDPGIKSAPAHVTQHPRGKLRVQYLGKGHSRRRYPAMTGIPNGRYAMVPPYVTYGAPYWPQPPVASLPYQTYQQQYNPYLVPAPHSAIARTHPMSPQVTKQTSTVQKDFESFMEKNKRSVVGTKDVFSNNVSRWAPLKAQPLSARDEFFFRHESTETTEPNVDEEEDVEMAIEDGAMPSPATLAPQNTVIQGEIKLQQETFAFELSRVQDVTDKKMFMSICDKVWDEAKELSRRGV